MRFLTIALAGAVAFGQTTKVFQLTQNENSQDLEEAATLLRTTANIQQLSIDNTTRTLTVNASDGQIAMAAWLVQQLDLPANASLGGVHEYRPPASTDDVVRVFYVTHASTPRQLQEIATTIRSVADIRRLSVYNALHVVTTRGTDRQISLAAWLVDQLNLPANEAAPAPHEFRVADDDVARVFELTNPQTPEQLQEIVTLIRSVADVMRLFIYTERRAMALRAPVDRVALAAWLVSELDKPAGAVSSGAAPHEYLLPNDPQNVVRVFYLAPSQSGEDRQKVVTQVRTNSGIRRLFVYDPLAALAVRGTAGQVATAEKVLEEMKAQPRAGSTPAP